MPVFSQLLFGCVKGCWYDRNYEQLSKSSALLSSLGLTLNFTSVYPFIHHFQATPLEVDYYN